MVRAWWLAVEQVADSAWPGLADMLDDGERSRAARFHFDHDRKCYIAAHALGRALLSSWAGGDPRAWRFQVGEHGKPEVLSPPGGPRLRLNLSHTRGLAAAVLTEDHDIGIDVEWLDRRAPTMDLAQRFFAQAECAQLEGLAEDDFVERFLGFWTLKEAYVKAIGKGLAQPLDSFAFTLEPLAIAFADAGADTPAAWSFRRFTPTPRHLMAVAVRAPEPVAVTVEEQRAEALYRLSPGMGAPATRP